MAAERNDLRAKWASVPVDEISAMYDTLAYATAGNEAYDTIDYDVMWAKVATVLASRRDDAAAAADKLPTSGFFTTGRYDFSEGAE